MIKEDREALAPLAKALTEGLSGMFRETYCGGGSQPLDPARYDELAKTCVQAAAVLFEIAERRRTETHQPGGIEGPPAVGWPPESDARPGLDRAPGAGEQS
jgi:hypothetical protein